MILHVKQIVDTCLYNSELPEGAVGRTERIVNHVIRADEFNKVAQVMRPQIHDVCERLDRLLKSSAEEKPPKPGNSASAGIGVYVYYDGNVEHVRNRKSKSRG
jgi:dTDP-glucose pyrophosphorylase